MLGVVVEEDALESLSALRRSLFARAFLIDLVARKGCPGHPLVQLAARAVALDSAALTDAALAADALLAALVAERERVDAARVVSAGVSDLEERVARATGGVSANPVEAADDLSDPDRRELIRTLSARLAMNGATDLARSMAALETAAGVAVAWQQRRRVCEGATRRSDSLAIESNTLNARIEACRAVAADDLPSASCPMTAEKLAALEASATDLAGRLQTARGAAGSACRDLPAAPPFETAPRTLADRIQTQWNQRAREQIRETEVGGALKAERVREARALERASVSIGSTAQLQPLTGRSVSLPSVTSFSTDLAFAVADFAIERMRDELVLSYLADIPGQFAEVTWLKDLFPQTHALTLGVEGARLYELSLPAWRSTLVGDLRRFPVHALRSDALLASTNATLSVHIGVRRLRVAVNVAESLREGTRPLDLLAGVSRSFSTTLHADDPLLPAFVGGATLAEAIAHDLRLQDVDVLSDSLPRYVLSERTLLQASEGHRTVYAALLASTVGHEVRPSMARYETLLSAVSTATGRTATLLAQIAETGRDTTRSGRAQRAASLIEGVLDVPLALADVLGTRTAQDIQAGVAALRPQWRAWSGILVDLDEGRATDALTRTLTLFSTVTGTSLVGKNGNVLSLVTLGAALADAEDSDAMVQAFRSTALPAGGYRARREGRGSAVSLHLYPGLVGGVEWLTFDENPSPAAGLSLPVGINIDLGRRFSLFASVLDLGAFLSYRLDGLTLPDSTQVDDTPDVTFREMLSPAIALSRGLGDWPVALSVSGQLMPSLRNLRRDGEDLPDEGVFRLGFSLSYDLPLFGLSPNRTPD